MILTSQYNLHLVTFRIDTTTMLEVIQLIDFKFYNDGKCKQQSCEVSITEDVFAHNLNGGDIWVHSHNPFDLTGYGKSFEEAYANFIMQFDYILEELNAFRTVADTLYAQKIYALDKEV